MNAAALSAQRRSRLQLILIALLFAAPVVSAWLAWQYAKDGSVEATTNAGQLVQPARPLQAGPWLDGEGSPLPDDLLGGLSGGRWSYVLLAGADCDAACQQRLYLTRQVRIGVNKDMSRVQRVLVVSEAPADMAALRDAHPDLVVAVLDPAALQRFAAQFPQATGLFLVDPLGNLMMRYPDEVPAKGMLKDLRKLLKVSQVG